VGLSRLPPRTLIGVRRNRRKVSSRAVFFFAALRCLGWGAILVGAVESRTPGGLIF